MNGEPSLVSGSDSHPVTLPHFIKAISPKIGIHTQLVRINTLSNQLDLSNYGVESILQYSYCLTNKIMCVGELVII